MTQQTLEEQVATLTEQVGKLTTQAGWMLLQVSNLYQRMQLPYVPATGSGPTNPRTETGMGAILSPDNSPFV